MHDNDNRTERKMGAIAILCEDHYNGWSVKGTTWAPNADAHVSDKGYPSMHRMAIFETMSAAQAYLDLNREILTKRCNKYSFLGFEVVQVTMWPEPTSFTLVEALKQTKKLLH